MTTFQLLLFIIAGVIFYLFFKQIFSGNHPKRGVDFEADLEDEQIGGINRPDKIFSKKVVPLSRLEQLLEMADEAVQNEDYEEAKKALGSALIIDPNSQEALFRMGYVTSQTKAYEEAKEVYETLLTLDKNDDTAHGQFANVLHHLKDDVNALKHHKEAIRLNKEYAPHYFNYANTLYDLGNTKEALLNYEKAYALDNTIETAKQMIEKLGDKHE